MKYLLQIVIITLIFSSCKPNERIYENYKSEVLQIERISDKVFQHISYLETNSLGTVPCNGMIYINGNEAIIFDTPTNNKASSELINWIGDKNIKAVVVTHFHIDCLGGLSEFHSKGIKSFATNQTIQLAKEDDREILPQNSFDREHKFLIENKVVFAKYFGQGHTKDNIVGYVPSEKTLFGGCLVKSLNAPKGNLADANTENWSKTVEKVWSEFPEIENVIPGHGKNGGTELLEYTFNQFKVYNKRFVFFLHNRYLETHELEESHPEFGRTEYKEILSEFEKSGLNVISEKRKGNVNAREYAQVVVHQIDSLISIGVKPNKITVVGTSKGGYIAQYVSTLANNPELNFVFIASFQDNDIQNIPEINYCGNILNIFEKSDSNGVSAIKRKEGSTCKIDNFKEIELNTGMGHGFLFKPLMEWIEPTIQWANGNYEINK
jgi:glyoxylase-like metal-dependent hydrolase (beta-lactamase superfamily II)